MLRTVYSMDGRLTGHKLPAYNVATYTNYLQKVCQILAKYYSAMAWAAGAAPLALTYGVLMWFVYCFKNNNARLMHDKMML